MYIWVIHFVTYHDILYFNQFIVISFRRWTNYGKMQFSKNLIFFVSAPYLQRICGNIFCILSMLLDLFFHIFVENIKCENIECCCDYVLATHAHAWPSFPRWTSTSMQKFDKNILFAPALLSPWPQECQNMLLERKVNTFAKS